MNVLKTQIGESKMTNCFDEKVKEICNNIANMLIAKNKSYGDAALSPIRVFSKLDSTQQILVRIDDKLSRIAKGTGEITKQEDTILDLIGYLILLKISLCNKK